MKDININELDAGIREHVTALRAAGFNTTDSGDGVSKFGTDAEECAMPFPNIAIVLDAIETVEDFGELAVGALRAQAVLDEIEDGWIVEATWSTADRVPLVLCRKP